MTDSTTDWARPMVHFEITTTDVPKMRDFYATLFNYNMKTEGTTIPIPAGIGGPLPGPGGTLRQASRSGVSLYFQVLKIEETLAKAETMGAKILSQPVLTPAGQTVASMLDPDGNRVVLVQQ